MTIYTKVEKETATYKKVDKTSGGWFRQGWFTNWFGGGDQYEKIIKIISTYIKVDK